MEKLNKDIMDAIKKSLPETTAGVLKEFIDQNKIMVKELKDEKSMTEYLRGNEKTLEEEIERLEAFEKKEDELKSTEERLNALSSDIENENTRLSIEAARLEERSIHTNERINDYQFMFETVFRNTSIRKDILKNRLIKNQEVNSGMYDNEGKPIMQDGGESLIGDNETETTTEE